jgi:DNA polymerase III delta prime subunit
MNVINKPENEKIKKKFDIHQELKNKLNYFIDSHKIPHIIFYGESGTGKREVLNYFINKIYNSNKEKIKEYVMYVNCAHGKGIRFIRDELKFFAKTNIQNDYGKIFKSIILLNAEKLTTDAQSALRRCIETFSHNTRFFIIIENIDNLLNPILSRFCNIYIPYPSINNKRQNLHMLNNNSNIFFDKKDKWLRNKLLKKNLFSNLKDIINFSDEIYNKGYSGMDILNVIISSNIEKKYNYIFYFEKIRKEFRNEKMLIFIYCYFLFMRKNINLENLLTM